MITIYYFDTVSFGGNMMGIASTAGQIKPWGYCAHPLVVTLLPLCCQNNGRQ